MTTLASRLLLITESLLPEIGDIIDTSNINFDPTKTIGRIRGFLDTKRQYRVEYPDGTIGVYAVGDKGVMPLTTAIYNSYVENLKRLKAEDPGQYSDLDINKIVHKVNHWITRRKKHGKSLGKNSKPVGGDSGCNSPGNSDTRPQKRWRLGTEVMDTDTSCPRKR